MAGPSRKNQFKIVLLGEGCVGKTSLMLRYVQDKFNDKHLTTLQVCGKKIFFFPFFVNSYQCRAAMEYSQKLFDTQMQSVPTYATKIILIFLLYVFCLFNNLQRFPIT